MTTQSVIGAVIIGRNEGDRLRRCLASVTTIVDGPVVYVDSGSTDGSMDIACAAGAEVVDLDLSEGFTAARARNAGLNRLETCPTPPELVQFIDGDCELRADWIATAHAFLQAHPDVVAVCGRRRERFPEASLYNRLADAEWDTPVGEARACGGDALMRRKALTEVGGFNPALIAGEEPELCVRLRQKGGRIWRLDVEMTWHDAAMTRFGQWWRRTRRAGHAFAEGAVLHGAPPEHHNVAQMRRALLWGVILPACVVLGSLLTPWMLLLLLAWPARVLRMFLRGMEPSRAAFLVLGNFAEALGCMEYFFKRRLGHRSVLIEYK